MKTTAYEAKRVEWQSSMILQIFNIKKTTAPQVPKLSPTSVLMWLDDA